MNPHQDGIRHCIEAGRAKAREKLAIRQLPDVAKNKAQRELQAKHGTPKEFAEKCIKAVGDMISFNEAKAAILKYKRQWKAAGHGNKSAL